jgi:hypothetical protein
MAQLHKMHTHAHDIAEKCVKMFGCGEKDDTEKVQKLAKAVAERDALVKGVGDLTATVETLQKRIAHLEKLPAPRKGLLVAPDGGRHDDLEKSADDTGAAIPPAINRTALRLSPAEERQLNPMYR